MDNSAIQLLLSGLSPDEVQELVSVVDYLGERADPARNPGGNLPEGSVASVMNRASPRVKEKLARLVEAIDTPRFQPFAPKRSEAERADEFGLDPDITQTVKSALDNQGVMASLQRRMGSDADLPVTPPSMRDLLQAAYEQSPQQLHPRGDGFLPGMANAGEGLDRKEAIKRIYETMGGK